MRPQRLSYGTAGAAVQPRGERRSAPRSSAPARAPAGLEVSLPYGTRLHAPAANRRIVIATLLALHGIAIVGLMNASRLRDAVAEARPIFLAVVDAPAPVARPQPLPPPPSLRVPAPPPLELPLIAPEPSPSPSPLLAQVAAPAPPPAPVAQVVEVAPVQAPAPASKTIPASAVQYLVPPAPVYSRISARMKESGKALIRVYIDAAGMPRNVQLATSTGFTRLDDAALAAVRNCRFKPYLENGVAVAGWAAIPIEFELPR
jgi:protein TonB